MKVKIKRLTETAKLPTRGSDKAAGYDLYADINEPIRIMPHCTVKIGSGVALGLPDGYAGFMFARSGLATKRGLRPANAVGVCDSDYRGEYIVPLHNDSDQIQIVEPGERIAQVVVIPVTELEFTEVKELNDTARGDGGFGSTGTN